VRRTGAPTRADGVVGLPPCSAELRRRGRRVPGYVHGPREEGGFDSPREFGRPLAPRRRAANREGGPSAGGCPTGEGESCGAPRSETGGGSARRAADTRRRTGPIAGAVRPGSDPL